eukprot:1119917-Pyramimonas_sp.AAC.1
MVHVCQKLGFLQGCKDYQDTNVTPFRGTVFWHDSGSSNINTQIDSWRCNLESDVIFQRLSPNGAFPAV